MARQTLFTFPGGGRLTLVDIITVSCCIVFFTALFAFFHHTRLGRQFRGAAENPLLASQRQVNVNLILALAWGTAVFSASLAGVLFGSRSMLSPQSTDHRPERADGGPGRRSRQPARRRDRWAAGGGSPPTSPRG